MAKIWPNAKITAADYDPVSVEISEVNAGINNVNFNICESDGYSAKMVKNSAPYDLIASNILAAPLIQFAPDAAAVLAKGGYLILAGLLVKQAEEVLAAHTANGLKLVDSADYGDWAVLVLRK
jgi:ribosomal protein L11 methyltransferase